MRMSRVRFSLPAPPDRLRHQILVLFWIGGLSGTPSRIGREACTRGWKTPGYESLRAQSTESGTEAGTFDGSRPSELDSHAELQTTPVILRIDVRGFAELAAGDAHVRVVVVHVVERVEGIHVQLVPYPLGYGEVLVQSSIDMEVLGPADVGVIPGIRAPGKRRQLLEYRGIEPAVWTRIGDMRITGHDHSTEVQQSAGVKCESAGQIPAAEHRVQNARSGLHQTASLTNGKGPRAGPGNPVTRSSGIEAAPVLQVVIDIVVERLVDLDMI